MAQRYVIGADILIVNFKSSDIDSSHYVFHGIPNYIEIHAREIYWDTDPDIFSTQWWRNVNMFAETIYFSNPTWPSKLLQPILTYNSTFIPKIENIYPLSAVQIISPAGVYSNVDIQISDASVWGEFSPIGFLTMELQLARAFTSYGIRHYRLQAVDMLNFLTTLLVSQNDFLRNELLRQAQDLSAELISENRLPFYLVSLEQYDELVEPLLALGTILEDEYDRFKALEITLKAIESGVENSASSLLSQLDSLADNIDEIGKSITEEMASNFNSLSRTIQNSFQQIAEANSKVQGNQPSSLFPLTFQGTR